jgi:hypothetical protein
MQVRFTDQSIVSLRDQSLLKIDEYKFTGKQDGMEKAFFNLVKGGFRTITGLIGKVNKTNYGVKTATATIGIRGTNFALLHCTAGNCGVAAKDGLYGGVSGGIISASNRTGEYQYGSGDYFYIPSEDEPAQKLIGPPDFLADHLTGQGRVEGRQAAFAGNERSENGGAGSDGRPNKLTPPPPQQAFIVTENLCANGLPCVLSPSSVTSTPSVPPPALPPAANTVLELAWVSPTTIDTVQANTQPTVGDTITLSGSQMIAYGISSTTQKGTLGSGSVVDQGNDPVGNMFWGRWVPGSPTPISVTDSSNATVNALGVTYIYGSFATFVPSSGTVTFNFAGGPRPVDAAGNVGTITSGGSLSVNFTAQSVNMASPLTFNIGGLSYNMNTLLGASYPSPALPQISGTLTGTCTGGTSCSAGAAAQGNLSAHFTGATGAGLGIALATIISTPLIPTPNVALAAAYKCPSC